jgi:hypothetical protein
MEPDLPASVADRDDAAIRATCEFLAGLDAQNQAAGVAVTVLMWTPSTPSSASARVHQRPWEQDIELVMSGSLLCFGCLVATNSKRP